jgi:hypothetical protein
VHYAELVWVRIPQQALTGVVVQKGKIGQAVADMPCSFDGPWFWVLGYQGHIHVEPLM